MGEAAGRTWAVLSENESGLVKSTDTGHFGPHPAEDNWTRTWVQLKLFFFFKLQQYRSGIWGIFVPRSTSRSFQRPVQNSKGLRGKLFYILELYNAVSKNDTNYDQHSNIWSRYTAREVFSRSELWKRDSERAAHASPQASQHGAQWAAHHCWWLLSKLRREAQLQEIKHGAQSTDTAHAKTISILNRWDFSLCRHGLWIWESIILLFRVIFY